MRLLKLVASWVSATLAVGAAASLGGMAGPLALSLFGVDEPVAALASVFLAGFCGVGMAYLGAPSRPLLFAGIVFLVGGFTTGLLPASPEHGAGGLRTVVLAGGLGGLLALGLAVARESRRAESRAGRGDEEFGSYQDVFE